MTNPFADTPFEGLYGPWMDAITAAVEDGHYLPEGAVLADTEADELAVSRGDRSKKGKKR